MRKTESSVVAVIPARWASTRFPGKPMAELAGEPMIAHEVLRAYDAKSVDHLIVATVDERIAEATTQQLRPGEAKAKRLEIPWTSAKRALKRHYFAPNAKVRPKLTPLLPARPKLDDDG